MREKFSGSSNVGASQFDAFGGETVALCALPKWSGDQIQRSAAFDKSASN